MTTAVQLITREPRIPRSLWLSLREHGPDGRDIVSRVLTLNLSRSGMLVEIPPALEVVQGEEIDVTIFAADLTVETRATIMRFESPIEGDPFRQAMGLRLDTPLPDDLVDATP